MPPRRGIAALLLERARNVDGGRLSSLTDPQRRTLGVVGTFVALLGIYGLSHPGRIDIIDGQFRYEVAKNWLDIGDPCNLDPYLPHFLEGDRAKGRSYPNYNAAASVTPMPLMLVSRALPGHSPERDRFAFSLVSVVFGAAGGALLMIGMFMLNVPIRRAVLATGTFCLGTLWWPGSITTFDQNQHSVFVLASTLLAWQAGRRSSVKIAALGGAVGGLLVNYQENYALLLPALALAVFASPGEGSVESPGFRAELTRAGVLRYLVFGVSCALGVALFVGFNQLRYGTPLVTARYDATPVFDGNFLAGSISLLASPGKSVVLFSPPILLVAVGARALFRRAPILTVAIALTSIVHFAFISRLALFGGDWCWGPRYLLLIMLLWALSLPFAFEILRPKRALLVALVSLGLFVQVMAISLDHQRFFFEHSLPAYFWLGDPWIYFKYSQFLSRPAEIVDVLRNGVPPQAKRFSSTPTRESTYSPYGPPRVEWGPVWMKYFSVYHLPRPWPLWVNRVEPELRPVGLIPLVPIGLALTLSGLAAVLASCMERRPETSAADAGAP